jgi:hypothetical protein
MHESNQPSYGYATGLRTIPMVQRIEELNKWQLLEYC